MRSIDEIRAELAEAEAREKEERQRIRNSVQPQVRFTVFVPQDTHVSGRIWDDTITVYRVEAEVLNKKELKEVGRSADEGGMSYYFNTLTGKLICPTSGGTLYFHSFSKREDTEASEVARGEIEAFIAENPEGGDITSIIEKYKATR